MIFFIIIMLGCATIGIVYFIIFFKKAIRGYQQKYWAKTYGRILDHEILKKWYHIYPTYGGRPYVVILKEYEYEINGTAYVQREELDRIGEDRAMLRLNLIPIGSNVEVYYNPQNPEESTIEPGMKGWDSSYLFYSIFWMIIAGSLFVPTYREILVRYVW